jgi:hypothetical protein
MQKKAVVLLSGGLDSTLACRILQEQGIEIEAINFRTAFACCKDDALEAARQFGIKVSVLSLGEDYFKLVEKPKYGWGKGINPCVDCRAYMFRLARKFMELCGASFVASGEVLGQRPMSQMMRQLTIIEEESGLKGLLLRPLSAKLLAPTFPEENGIVDRERLYGISGRSRKELLTLAVKYGIDDPPTPSTGCLLTEPDFAKKVRDVFDHVPEYTRWHFDTLKVGRHFRLSAEAKAILGRDQEENKTLEVLHREGSVLIVPANFKGPSALIVGKSGQELEEKVSGLILHYTKHPLVRPCLFERHEGGAKEVVSYGEAGVSEEELASLRI